MKIVSAAQMRAIDKYAINELGISAASLMERAGQAVAAAADRMLYLQPGPVIIICGKGNNGGDGLVAARLLHETGSEVLLVLPFSRESLSDDAQREFDRTTSSGVAITPEVSDEQLAQAALIIDAMLGTGITGAVSGVLGELIIRVNKIRGGHGVLAVDLPSGVNADSGAIPGPCITAENTITLGLPKPALVLFPAAIQAGQWQVDDIGFPPDLLESIPPLAVITEVRQACAWLPYRPPTAHKRSVGFALVIAGSFGMNGAAAMCAAAAYRAGAGLVRLAIPASLAEVLNAQLTEVVFRPQPETSNGTLSFRAVNKLLAEASEVQATVIGPGLSRNKATQLAIRRLVAAWPGPLVVDADALTAMAGHDELWQERRAPTIITPHPGEMSRLLATSIAECESNRIATAIKAAQRFNAITVYKGSPLLIAAPDGGVYVNPTGNTALAVAGSGDVLAGTITAMLAQGLPAMPAAALAAFAGGWAAQISSEQLGIRGVTAPDLIAALPAALQQLADTRREDDRSN